MVFPSIMKFELGRLMITPAVLSSASVDDICRTIDQHVCGQRGDILDLVRITNEVGLSYGGHLLSAFHITCGVELRVLTAADRLTTTIYLPSENGHRMD